jgi:hypothetical protein
MRLVPSAVVATWQLLAHLGSPWQFAESAKASRVRASWLEVFNAAVVGEDRSVRAGGWWREGDVLDRACPTFRHGHNPC